MRRPGVSTIARRSYTTGVREVAVSVTNLWRSPAVVGEADAPMLGRVPDPQAWVQALGRSRSSDLEDRVDTQLLLGEPVRVLEERGEWCLVSAVWQPSHRHESGYPGWVRTEHLAGAAAPSPTSSWVTVTAHDVVVTVDRTGQHIPVSYGTCLRVLARSADVLVSLQGRRVSHLPHPGDGDGTADTPASTRPWPSDRLVQHGRRFVGRPYLWGGLGSWGTDCSGLVHLAYRSLGLVVPRDASDQHAASRPVARPQSGDLYFFAHDGQAAHHVGIATGDGRILHAPGSDRAVEEVTLPPDRAASLLGAGRIEA